MSVTVRSGDDKVGNRTLYSDAQTQAVLARVKIRVNTWTILVLCLIGGCMADCTACNLAQRDPLMFSEIQFAIPLIFLALEAGICFDNLVFLACRCHFHR